MVARWAYPGSMIGLLLIATALRVMQVDLTEFRLDEGWAALLATNWLDGGPLPLTGIATTVRGLRNPPLFIYLIAIPLAIARDPALITIWLGILNVAAIGLTGLLVDRIQGQLAALFTVVTFATGSWAIYFSRKIWPNDAMPLFCVVLAFGLYLAIVEYRPWGLGLAGLGFAGLINLHPSSATLIPFVFAAIALRPRILLSRWTAIAAFIVALVSTSYAVNEFRTGFPAVAAALSVGGGALRLDDQAIRFAFEIIGPGANAMLAGDAIDRFRAHAWPETPLDQIMSGFLALGFIATLVDLILRLRRRQPWHGHALLLLWLVLPLAMASRRSIVFSIHYLVLMLPVLFTFVSFGLIAPWRLARRAARPIRIAALALPVGLIAWVGAITAQQELVVFDLVRTAGAQTIIGVPLRDQQAAVTRARHDAGDDGIVFVSQPGPGTDADDLLPRWRFFVPPPTPLRFADGGGLIRVSTQSELYVVAPTADRLADNLLANVGTSTGPGVALPGLDRGYSFWRASASAIREGSSRGSLGEHLRLERANIPDRIVPGSLLPASFVWRVMSPPPSEEFAYFVHLVNDRREKLAGYDRAGLRGGETHQGDALLTWATLSIPPGLQPGRYWLSVGLYRTRDIARLPARDGLGAPAGDAIPIGPMKIARPESAPEQARNVRPAIAFTDAISLIGWTIAPQSIGITGSGTSNTSMVAIDVDLSWRGDGRPSRDLTEFIHVIDVDGKLIAQSDQTPGEGSAPTYPTSIWDSGEVVASRRTLTVPVGRYRVIAGLYDPRTLARLARIDRMGDSVDLGTFETAP